MSVVNFPLHPGPDEANTGVLSYYDRRTDGVEEVAMGITLPEMEIILAAFERLHSEWAKDAADLPEVLRRPTDEVLGGIGARLDHARSLLVSPHVDEEDVPEVVAPEVEEETPIAF